MASKRLEVVKDAVRRFNHLPNRTIAKHLLHTHGGLWDNDLEKIRQRVRYVRGQHGERNRDIIADKSLFVNGPIKIPETWRRIRKPYHLDPGLWLVLSDIHVPFHEPKPIEAAIQAGQAEQIDGIFFNGDIQECQSLSYWPTARKDFNREVELTIDFLDFIQCEFPDKPIVYKPGNHEYRLPRFFMAQAAELALSPLAAMETVMDFEGRGIEFLDYHQLVMAGDLPIIHGHEVQSISRAVNPARGLFLRTKTFAACSHCHSTSQHTPKDIHGNLLTTWSFGCLCNLEPEWNPLGNDWNHGFGFVNVEKDGNFEVINRRILPTGKVV